MAEFAKGRVNRKMQETGEWEEEKKLQHPLKTAASPRSSGYGGWEGRGGRQIFGFIVIAGSRCPAIVYEHVNLTYHHLGGRTHTRETKHGSNIYNK